MFIHVVVPGETLYRIAARYSVSVADIIEANGLEYPNRLIVGQSLIIPTEDTTHSREGESHENSSNVPNLRSGNRTRTISPLHQVLLLEQG